MGPLPEILNKRIVAMSKKEQTWDLQKIMNKAAVNVETTVAVDNATNSF